MQTYNSTDCKTLPIFLFLTLLLSIQITYAQLPEPPEGKVWVQNLEMSDEFGETPLEEKWIIYDKQNSWDRTAAFDKRVHEIVSFVENGKVNYALTMNPMWYAPEDIFTRGSRTYNFAGGAMNTRAEATFGYFEVRIKPSNFPMGSGVFMNSRSYSLGACGEKYHTELDIIENMGYNGPGAGDWNNQMHINSHVKPTDENCSELPYITEGGPAEPLNVPLGYNTVAAWWKDENTALFYLDGKYFATINPKRAFNLSMPLILTMETYGWGSDENNATNPKPEEYMFQDDFRTKEERALSYDWVRSWYLADLEPNRYSSDKQDIGFLNNPFTAFPTDELKVDVVYSTVENREILISVYDENKEVIGSKKMEAEAGVRTKTDMVWLDVILSTTGVYSIKCELLKAGTAEVLDSEELPLSVTEKPIKNQILNTLLPSTVFPSNTYTVELAYEAESDMELALELRNPSGQWIGGGLATVDAGRGIATVKINVNEVTSVQDGYFWKGHMRPIGQTWRESVGSFASKNVDVVPEFSARLKIADSSFPLYKNAENVRLYLEYDAPDRSDIQISVKNSKGSLVGTFMRDIDAGKDIIELLIPITDNLDPNDSYTLTATMKSKVASYTEQVEELNSLEVQNKEALDAIEIILAAKTIRVEEDTAHIKVNFFTLQKRNLVVNMYNKDDVLIAHKSIIIDGEVQDYEVEIPLRQLTASEGNYFKASIWSTKRASAELTHDISTNVSITEEPLSLDRYKNNNLTMYPNPVSDILNLDLSRVKNISEFDYQIVDVTGKSIKQFSSSHVGSNLSIDTSELASGLYILKIQAAKKSFNTKFIKN